MEHIFNNELFTGAFLLSIMGTVLYSLKAFPIQLWEQIKKRIIYTVRIYEYDDLYFALEKWIQHNYKQKYKTVEASFQLNKNHYVSAPTDDSIRKIYYKQDVSTFVIRYKGRRVLVSTTKEKLENTSEIKNVFFSQYNIYGFFCKKVIQEMLEEVSKYDSESRDVDTRLPIYTVEWSNWIRSSMKDVKPLNKIVMRTDVKESLIKDVELFNKSKIWYRETNIPYKRGYLFYGPPGTGKTSTALAVARSINKPVFVLNLNGITSDNHLLQIFGNIQENTVLLIEDIDASFSGRISVKEDSKISFSCLLNCLDGASSKEGIITIITTNHLEKLDPALIREGRIDVKVEIPKASEAEISEYMSLFYDKDITIDFNIQLPICKVQEICLQNRNSAEKAIHSISQNKIEYA